jgi:hypothetical protein
MEFQIDQKIVEIENTINFLLGRYPEENTPGDLILTF